MNTELEKQILGRIVARWKQGQLSIASETIYDELTQQGIAVPDGAMTEIVQSLLARGLINGPHPTPLDSHAERTHGAVIVTWVNPALL